jgi:hypothetical protein
MNLSRYILTERRDGDSPSDDDPKAQAFQRHAGVYDIRDTQSGNVICASAGSLTAARKVQANWNSMALGFI